jgi:hypothetical protein
MQQESHEQTTGSAQQEAIAQELESTRAKFHQLIASVPPTAWRRHGPGSAWTVKEELWHIAWGAHFMLDLIKNARRGIGLPKPPMTLADPLNALYTKFRAALVPRDSIGPKYDRVHAAILKELGSIREDEWERSVSVFGERQTIAELFHGISLHFEEHAARIRPALDVSRRRGRQGGSHAPS